MIEPAYDLVETSRAPRGIRLALRARDGIRGVVVLPTPEQRLVVVGELAEVVIEGALRAAEAPAEMIDRQPRVAVLAQDFEPGEHPVVDRCQGRRECVAR